MFLFFIILKKLFLLRKNNLDSFVVFVENSHFSVSLKKENDPRLESFFQFNISK